MHDDTIEPFGLPAVGRKKVTAAFDGGRITSDGGVMLLATAERHMGIAQRLAALIADPRDPLLVTHSVADILRARMLAIACGYEDADDLDHLRTDPGFKLACGRLPDTGNDLCSQPTVSRWENAPTLREVVRMTYAMIDTYCASHACPPAAVTLELDDTVGVVHGHQQLPLFNAHYNERCFLPIRVYDTATSRPVAVLLRSGKTPSGDEIRHHLTRLVRRIRSHWPTTRLTIRGDGHYGRPEVMAWCEANAVDFILGLPGNAVLSRLVETAADDVRVRRAEAAAPVLRRYAETRYGAKSWGRERRVAARIEATTQGLDIRYVVTNPDVGSAEWLYDTLYCARGQAENLIKLHKSQLASDRTSCRSARANQVRLVLHTAAYWLMLTVRDAIPKPESLATAEFTSLRMRLLKIAARITETATRVRLAFAAACPEAELFRGIARSLQLAGP
ncbi:IS1380 family transposase [Limobrevibacterium gyesilva]|uniref:IS1380 family transposase n=1 Tax=Limobrevibacterium gyesilva TaxID=2991712 RepID=A0AA41YP23_9PROT|nr:IS1380 family transposase [Limobrevibacterium gyesilva]MCW3477464.1 IS1380 family transposase [Limobrevibacterium gyesilva]